MPHRDPIERSKNFEEVALGFDEATAINEAERCLNLLLEKFDDDGWLIIEL
jgi:hypothetical protein